MWDLPRPGLEPVSPALAGGFLTTAPPGKPSGLILICGCPVSFIGFLHLCYFKSLSHLIQGSLARRVSLLVICNQGDCSSPSRDLVKSGDSFVRIRRLLLVPSGWRSGMLLHTFHSAQDSPDNQELPDPKCQQCPS